MYVFRSGPALLVPVLIISAGCAAKTITFTSNEKATVSLVPPGATDGQGQVLGETPVTVEVEKLEGKVAKIAGENVVPQFWIVHEPEGDETKVALKLEKRDGDKKNAGKQGQNLKYRLVMKAYKALADQDWKLARDLAGELTKIDAEVAAPHLIEGIAFLREGKKADARSSFEKALTLDPEDAEISKLIQVSQ